MMPDLDKFPASARDALRELRRRRRPALHECANWAAYLCGLHARHRAEPRPPAEHRASTEARRVWPDLTPDR